MKDIFITGLKNVKRFRSAVEHIHHAKLKGMERMALIFGAPGLGKSETALQFAANNGALYMRMKKLMTARWFLGELIDCLGGSPKWRTQELFNQVLELLKERKRTLILDEVDYFTSDSKIIETLRDFHDITGTPMIFIGMNQADKRLMRYPHLYDRFIEVVKFQPLDREDVELMIKELSEINFDGDAIEKIVSESEGKIRKILAFIHRAEYIAAKNRLKSIQGKDLK
jgi:DNA transposition AAA+ family ATPase